MTKGSDIPCVLVLGGLDPSGGAGLLADAQAIRAAGARPLCVATALTVQTTRRVRRFEPCNPQIVADSVKVLLEEENVRAIKIGMIGAAEVAQALRLPDDLPRVVDPVLRASSGAPLLLGSADLYVQLAQGALITPNLPEAALLPPDLLARGCAAVLLKGGHGKGETVVDTLSTATFVEELRAPRIDAQKRGTGCRLASFAAARIALGHPLREAVVAARTYVRAYLAEP
ncbi:MAG TPA: hydroxymethylpyrimidine/phosphomethylpyrimidine kinase [Myxococcales bacterium]|jgi:hydroxymethylpyrimidine/phosphomethylpyrimidine kinase